MDSFLLYALFAGASIALLVLQRYLHKSSQSRADRITK